MDREKVDHVLQIATGKYFRDVQLHVKRHRRVLFTNANFLQGDPIRFPDITLFPSTASESVTSVTVEFVERLEAVDVNGKPEMLLSTGGTEMLDDIASVLSFALNVTFSPDHELVRRLIPAQLGSRGAGDSPAQILRRTCDPGVFVTDSQIGGTATFIERLMGLNRSSYERAIRGIRQIVNACRRVADDPTLSYTMLVAAMEAMGAQTVVAAVPWEAVDGRKRKLFDEVLAGLEESVAERIRQAVIESERAGAKRRFITFVNEHLTEAYFREGASEAVRPASAFKLKKALSRAYDIRSKNVHVLEVLRPETWLFGDRGEIVNPAGAGLMLSLEGLNRLSRHVIGEYVSRAQTAQTEPFNYRAALPNIFRATLAPQYWISDANGLARDSIGRYFEGFVALLIQTLREGSGEEGREGETIDAKHMPDLRPLLTRIEMLAPGLHGPLRLSLIAIYVLWHRLFIAEMHSPQAESFIERYGGELEAPSMQSFIAACLCREEPSWTLEKFKNLLADSIAARAKGAADPIPSVFYAALAAEVAERLAADGVRGEAIATLSQAIEELPGNSILMQVELKYLAGGAFTIDLHNLVLGGSAFP